MTTWTMSRESLGCGYDIMSIYNSLCRVVKCIHCGREFHSICVLYHPAIWGGGYQCDGCLKAKGTSRRENKFCARRESDHTSERDGGSVPLSLSAGLPTNKLSNFLEERVNMFLRSSDSGAEVIIRTVSSFDKVLDTRPLMKDRFPVRGWGLVLGGGASGLQIRGNIDGEVCFFIDDTLTLSIGRFSGAVPLPDKGSLCV